MGTEFRVIKEMATITATLLEVASIDKLIGSELSPGSFNDLYRDLLLDIIDTYQGVQRIVSPLVEADHAKGFSERFPGLKDWFSDSYQQALSVPRINAETTFQKYLQFRKRKEMQTKYPPLKAAFSRLHDIIDKWIDNDIWLAMSIDGMLKTLNLFLGDAEVALTRDKEEGYALYHSCIGNLAPHLLIMDKALESLCPQPAPMQQQAGP